MKTFSVSDLTLIPELSHLGMFDFIDPNNAELIAPFLKVLGFDLDYPVEFVASQHRNLQGQVVVAYQLVGEVECNASFLESSFATPEDRIIAASYKDLSLARKLQAGQISSREYGDVANEAFPPDLVNPDEDFIKGSIKLLEDVLIQVRGNPHKKDGSQKTWFEYCK